jgi:hypothetical protein
MVIFGDAGRDNEGSAIRLGEGGNNGCFERRA